MAFRRVLVIYKCSRFARTDKHTPIKRELDILLILIIITLVSKCSD